MNRPHVVLLGAGASLAALPHGDRWGKKLPLMHNLVELVGLEKLLDRAGIEHQGLNFEVLYSRLATDSKHADVVQAIDAMIFSYFHGMRLPDHPTIYDHLVLSLRPKDLIATFNWDPFLIQALERNYSRLDVSPPECRHLHGCTWLAYCDRHQPMIVQQHGHPCGHCGQEMRPTRLLYPVTQKHYGDPHCSVAWHDVQSALQDAYLFTVFGYSAPSTDVEAVRLLKEAWGDPTSRRLEQVEVIDIKTEDALLATWKPFIHSHHHAILHEFEHSLIWRYPRRTCESFWNMVMQCIPEKERRATDTNDLTRLRDWHRQAIEQEQAYAASSAN